MGDEYAREPCPWRIIDDCGGAFSMGLIGGSLFQVRILMVFWKYSPSPYMTGSNSHTAEWIAIHSIYFCFEAWNDSILKIHTSSS